MPSARIAPGKAVEVTVWRDGKSEIVKVDLGELPGADEAGVRDDRATTRPRRRPTRSPTSA